MYVALGLSCGSDVHSDLASLNEPLTLPPSLSLTVMLSSVPELVTTLTGWSGRTAAAFLAGVTVTFAAAGSADGVWLWSPPGVVEAPGVELD